MMCKLLTVDNKITLNFVVEKGEPIDQYYLFSARMKLMDESKKLLHEKFGKTIQFANLNSYFNLSTENFYIYDNKYSGHNGRSELYIKSENGGYFTTNLSLNNYGLSVELSSEGPVNYGIYPLYVIYNPNYYNNAQEKVFDDSNELLPTVLNILENLLSNTNGLTIKDMFSQLQNEIYERKAREKRQVETEKNEELAELIEKGKIVLFKVVKGANIDDKRSAVALQLSEEGRGALDISKDIILNSQKFYIAKHKSDEFLHCVGPDYDTLFKHDDLFFVLNKDSHWNLKNGFIWL